MDRHPPGRLALLNPPYSNPSPFRFRYKVARPIPKIDAALRQEHRPLHGIVQFPMVADTLKSISHVGDTARQYAADYARYAGACTREHPVAVCAASVGVGLVIGWLLTHRS